MKSTESKKEKILRQHGVGTGTVTFEKHDSISHSDTNKTIKNKSKTFVNKEKITYKWLRDYVPINMWLNMIGLLFISFVFGVYASKYPLVNDLLINIFGYKTNIIYTNKTQETTKNQFNILTDAYNVRINQLYSKLSTIEKLEDKTISDNEERRNKITQLNKLIKEENKNFRFQLLEKLLVK